MRVVFEDANNQSTSIDAEYLIDTGATHSSFPGKYIPSPDDSVQGKLFLVDAKRNTETEVNIEHHFVLPTFGQTAAPGRTAFYRVFRNFTLTLNGAQYDAITINMGELHAPCHSAQNLLGLDVLLQMVGSWWPVGEGKSVMNLEKFADAVPQNTSTISTIIGGLARRLSELKPY